MPRFSFLPFFFVTLGVIASFEGRSQQEFISNSRGNYQRFDSEIYKKGFYSGNEEK